MTKSVKKIPEKHKKAVCLFVSCLQEGASVTRAAQRAELDRSRLYYWRSQDAHFRKIWDEAIEAGSDVIEDEALRRAVEGVEKPVYRGGEVVGHVRDYSDAMLTMLLKARRPEKYSNTAARTKDDSLDLSGAKEALIRKFSQALEG